MQKKDFNAFMSPEYTVLRTLQPSTSSIDTPSGGPVALSLGLIVKGVPSFLATIPVDPEEIDDVVVSLDRGKVRVSTVGISVDESSVLGESQDDREPWLPDPPLRNLPAAFLSLVCADGRKIGVAKIVSRQDSTSPDEIARFVLRQIARGVQIPDLASTA